MQEAVHTKIVKLLDNRIIIPFLIANGSVLYTRFWRNPVSPWWKTRTKSWSKLDFPWKFEFASTIGSLM